MKKDKQALSNFIVNTIVLWSMLAIIVVGCIAIAKNLPKETLEDRLLMVLVYVVGTIVVYYLGRVIYIAISRHIAITRATSPTIFSAYWISIAIICLFRVFFPSDISTPITNQPEITKSLNNANTEGKIQILKANGLSKESVYDVLKNDYNFKILIKDGNSTFEKIYDDAATNVGK